MILDGKVTAAALEKDIRERIDVLKERAVLSNLRLFWRGAASLLICMQSL